MNVNSHHNQHTHKLTKKERKLILLRLIAQKFSTTIEKRKPQVFDEIAREFEHEYNETTSSNSIRLLELRCRSKNEDFEQCVLENEDIKMEHEEEVNKLKKKFEDARSRSEKRQIQQELKEMEEWTPPLLNEYDVAAHEAVHAVECWEERIFPNRRIRHERAENASTEEKQDRGDDIVNMHDDESDQKNAQPPVPRLSHRDEIIERARRNIMTMHINIEKRNEEAKQISENVLKTMEDIRAFIADLRVRMNMPSSIIEDVEIRDQI